MPYAHNADVRLYWEAEGKGEPLLLIMGLGFNHEMWYKLRPLLTPHFRVIVFDNRGIGNSDAPSGPYSVAQMAQDALAVLAAAGHDSAHVMGVSLGGAIAQEMTLLQPRAVRSLILGCTHPGFAVGARPGPEVVALFRNNKLRPEEAFWAMRPFFYSQHTPDAVIHEDFVMRSRAYPGALAYFAQANAGTVWIGGDRLFAIDCPTLILQGAEDLVILAANAEQLALRIKGAQVVILEHASHMFFTEQPQQTARLVIDFIQQHAACGACEKSAG